MIGRTVAPAAGWPCVSISRPRMMCSRSSLIVDVLGGLPPGELDRGLTVACGGRVDQQTFQPGRAGPTGASDAEAALAVRQDGTGDPEGDRQVVVSSSTPERSLEARPVTRPRRRPARRRSACRRRRAGGRSRSWCGRGRAMGPGRSPGAARIAVASAAASGQRGEPSGWSKSHGSGAPGDQGLASRRIAERGRPGGPASQMRTLAESSAPTSRVPSSLQPQVDGLAAGCRARSSARGRRCPRP